MPQAMFGLRLFENETRAIGRPSVPVIVTETGWCLDDATQALRATWTVQAYRQLWLVNEQLLAVTPFLLAGAQWEAKGFPWAYENGTVMPVFTAVKQLRQSMH